MLEAYAILEMERSRDKHRKIGPPGAAGGRGGGPGPSGPGKGRGRQEGSSKNRG